MTITLAATATAATAARLDLTGTDTTAAALEIQYGTRQDFLNCVAPIVAIGLVAAYNLNGLNQSSPYYFRVRETFSTGAPPAAWSNIAATYQPDAAARVTAPASVMIEPALIVLPVPVLNWTTNAEVAGHPPRLLDIDSPVAQWWATNPASYFRVEMETGGSPIDTLALLGTNAPETATITIRGGNSLADIRAGNGAPYTFASRPFRASANLPGRDGYHGFVRLPLPLTYKFWAIEIGGGPFPVDTFVATHAVLGLARVSKNYSQDKAEMPVDLGSFERTRGGDPDRVAGYRMRRVEFELSTMTEAQYELQYGDLMTRLNSRAFVVPNTKAGAFLHDRLLYGRWSGGKASNPFSPRFTIGFAVESII